MTVTDAGHHGPLERLARRGTASVLGAGVSAIFGVLLVVIVTNGFDPAVAGTLFAATSVFLILEAVAVLGTDTGLVKWLPTLLATGRGVDVRRTLVVAVVPVLLTSVGVSVVLHLVAGSLAPAMVGREAAATGEAMLRALALVLPVATLQALVLAATRGMGTMRPTVVVENIGRFSLQALAVLAVLLLDGGSEALALAWALPYLPGLVVTSLWLHRLVDRASGQAGAAVPAPWSTLTRGFWAYTGPRALARVVQAGLKRSDIVLVAALASPAAAALYTAATRFVVLGQLFVQAVQQALSPQLSSLFAQDRRDAADSVFQAATRWSMLAAWPLYLVMAGFAPTLMLVFGDGYDVASDVVVILSLTMLLATACGPVDSVLLMSGRSWLSLGNNTVALAINVGLNLALIPLLGIRGAAISWSVAIVVRNLLPLVQVRRQLGITPLTRSSLVVAAAAVACFGPIGVVGVVLEPPTAVAVALIGVGVAAYAASIWSLRAQLGLGAFRALLRRRGAVPTPEAPAPVLGR
jgi:O-antigen/teichoic acid export membrane protein